MHGQRETSLIERLRTIAEKRRPGDGVFIDFIDAYMADFSDFDFDERDDDEMYASLAYHFALGQRRPRGKIIVEARTPSADRDGWESEHSYVFIVTDDMPFLVDTMRIVLNRHHVRSHRLIPPMLDVVRADGVITSVVLGNRNDSEDMTEAWTQIQIDRINADEAKRLVADLTEAMESVYRTVGDFAEMQMRMASLGDLDPRLAWLADDHYVFLGAATYLMAPTSRGARGAPALIDAVATDSADAARSSSGQHGAGHPAPDDAGPRDGTGLRPVVIDGSALGSLKIDASCDPEIDGDQAVISFSRSVAESLVHRASRMTVVTVRRTRDDGSEVFERFVGLLSSAAYRTSVLDIPQLGAELREELGLPTLGAATHAGRATRNVLETIPLDLILELEPSTIARLVHNVVGLQERQIVRVFEVPEPVGTASTVLVYLPRQRYGSNTPSLVAEQVSEWLESPFEDVETLVGSSSLARITFTLTHRPDAPTGGDRSDLIELSERLDELTTSWHERIEGVHHRRTGASAVAATTLAKLMDAAPAEFRTTVPPNVAATDLERLAQLADTGAATMTALARELDAPADEWRVRVYQRGEALSLSELLPMLSHLGFDTLEEHPYEFIVGEDRLFLLDIGVRLPAGAVIDEQRHDQLLEALDALIAGDVEADGFNRLVLGASLSIDKIAILRAYANYAQQIRFTFSQTYIEETFARLPELARSLVEVFASKFDPDRSPGDDGRADEGRLAATSDAVRVVRDQLDQVESLDEDRIVRTFLHLIEATVRTSAYQGRTTVAFKFDPARVPELPEPTPAHEIFVSSRRVEGVHLRGGAIARGGIRWSDRFEDYRTEVLGLVKAQMVKNAVIVPVGAKGGFVVKTLGANATRDERQAEGIACYREYVSALLDVTDNLVDGDVVHPPRCVRYDGDDTYIVVAADKGTATFSDIANDVAAEYGFWLGDAFASGGSAGYDHKAMGITARGAWESVKRHGQYLGIDPEVDVITVVGIGDMSGDVFGNGMLLSRTLQLVCAFDHRHIFVDPNPDPAVSFGERERLFHLPRSSWNDYDRDLMSPGGGVFPRSLKAIEITEQMRAALGIADDVNVLTPNELISAALRAPVTLLWNGGIGTYIKASSETNSAVGDRGNDGVRINGSEVRAKMLVEGGNLGVTQLARVEYALRGGLVYTDAIDNSAGVDTSDHEVNIKILLGSVVEAGELTVKQRNTMLESMTDEVADLVLQDNKAQTLALMIAREQGLPMVNVHARYLDVLESEGYLNRALEFLPTDRQLAERQLSGSGLRAPELAVLIAYTKNVNIGEISRDIDLLDLPILDHDIIEYFPKPLRKKYKTQILQHRLRREIAATRLVNQMTNLSGISYDHRVTEDTGSSVADVARAWLTVREVLGFPDWWDEILALDGVGIFDQIELLLDCRRTAERASLWFVRNRRPPVDIAAETERFRDPMRSLIDGFGGCLRGTVAAQVAELAQSRVAQNVPEELAQRSAVWHLLHTSFDVIDTALDLGVEPLVAAETYWEMFDLLDLGWLWDAIAALPRSDRWQTQARSAVRDDLLGELAGLVRSVLEHPSGSVAGWLASNERSFDRTVAMLVEIRRSDAFNITNLSVALRQLRNLVTTSVRT